MTGRLVADEALASVHYGDPRTLRAVYAGEKWRGRDNLRVTLRPPMNLRSALSALQPLVTVAVLVAAINVAGGFRVTARMLKMFRR